MAKHRIPIHAFVCSDSDGKFDTGINLTAAQIRQWVTVANGVFNRAEIEFQFRGRRASDLTGTSVEVDLEDIPDSRLNRLGRYRRDPPVHHQHALDHSQAVRDQGKIPVFFRTVTSIRQQSVTSHRLR